MSARRAARHAADINADHQFAGTARLLRHLLRAEAMGIVLWVVGVVGLLYYMVLAVENVLGDAGLQVRAQVIGLPAGAMLTGPGYGLDDYTLPVMVANELLGLYAVAVAIMSLRLAVRHTRGDEEAGRTELLRALPVGKLAPLSAALLTCLLANLAVAVFVLLALRLQGFDAGGTAGFSLGILLVGLLFSAIAALGAQLSASARTASSLAGMVLGIAYLLRAVGDASKPGGSWLSWLSPIGWIQQQRLYVDQRWWPLVLPLALFVVLVVACYALQARREVGAGLLPQRAGRARATVLSRTVLGLAMRLDRGRTLGWAAAILVGGALTGSLAEPLGDAFRDLPQLQAVLGVRGGETALEDIVLAAMAKFLALFAMVVSIFAVQTPHRLRRDEALGRVDVVLAGRVSRWWVMGSQLLLGLGAGALLLVIAGLGLGLGAQASMRGAVLGTFVAAALWYLPVVACWLALSMLALGIGRGAIVVWILLVASIIVGMYGMLLNLPQAVIDIEPFTTLKALDIVQDGASIGQPAGYAAAAIVLGAGALIGYRLRDIEG